MIESDSEGECFNVYSDGDMIVSIDESRGEIAVYNREDEEPVAVHGLE